MRIYTPAGDLAFSTFTFPDGQPHFKLETYEVEFHSVTIETALVSPWELLVVALAADVLRNHGCSEINLDVRYLMGARMDRAINTSQPHTLQSVARIINSCGFAHVRLLDVHSEVATKLIRNASNVLPQHVVHQVWNTLGRPILVSPDKGAEPRFRSLFPDNWAVQCHKLRDMETGKLGGFRIVNWADRVKDRECLIIDDICDGGGTFVGLAEELRKAGATAVYLYVTHGIFSKGLPLEGIDKVFTTDSFGPWREKDHSKLVVIPISMKEL